MSKSLPIKQRKLKNGLTVVTVPMAGFHSVLSMVAVRTGSRHETPEINGVSHFLEHLVFKGTNKFADTQVIAQAIESLGGYFNAWTANDHTCYWNVMPSRHWRLGLEMASELAFFPKLNPADIDRERGVVIEEIRRYQDNPDAHVLDLAGDVTYPNHPLGWSVIGTEEIIGSVNRDTIHKYWQSRYQPNNALLIVIGDVDPDQAAVYAEELLGGLARTEVKSERLVTGPSTRVIKQHTKKTDQTHFVVSMSGPELAAKGENRFVAEVMDTILGDGMSSRLFLKVREEKGLCYSIRSGLDLYPDAGALYIHAGVNTKRALEATEAVKEQLDLLMTEPVGEDELKKAKEQLLGSMEISRDRPLDLARWYGIGILTGTQMPYDQAEAAISAVTPKQIQALAKQILAADRRTLTVIGPQENQDYWQDKF